MCLCVCVCARGRYIEIVYCLYVCVFVCVRTCDKLLTAETMRRLTCSSDKALGNIARYLRLIWCLALAPALVLSLLPVID